MVIHYYYNHLPLKEIVAPGCLRLPCQLITNGPQDVPMGLSGMVIGVKHISDLRSAYEQTTHRHVANMEK